MPVIFSKNHLGCQRALPAAFRQGRRCFMKYRQSVRGFYVGPVLAGCIWLGAAALGLAQPASPAPTTDSTNKAFVDVTDQAGVRHRHEKVVLDKKLERIMPWMSSIGASVAACDYNKDGWIDL